MRRGFTMIELIFVIVIIAILAAAAVSKLAINRTDAQAAVCVHEAGQLIEEIVGQYTKRGYSKFRNLTIEKMTNIQALPKAVAGQNSVKIGDKVDTSGAKYYCDGEAVVEFKAVTDSSDYNLTITPKSSGLTSPAAARAAKLIKENMTNNQSSKTITM